MTWLVWKEYRLNRVILIVGVVLLVLPHVVFVTSAWYAAESSAGFASRLPRYLIPSGLWSVALAQLTLCLLGGHLIACERVDRSAEFLAYLPVSRARILAGKITLALLCAASLWIPNLEMPVWSALGYTALTGLVLFSIGWLLSSLLESPTFAICGALATTFAILMAIQTLAWLLEYEFEVVVGLWYRYTCLTLAPLCFVAGTWSYLRRVEP
jgi:ABC-type transport system involved in multi-copper enzyme maturation permease subunit